MNEAYIVSAVRTPIGKYLGGLSELPAVELGGKRPHLSPLDFPTEESLRPIRALADSLGVEVATIAGYTDFTVGHKSLEVPLVEMQVAYVRDLARMAKALGAKIVRVFTGYFTEPTAYQADWTKCVTALQECAEVASKSPK